MTIDAMPWIQDLPPYIPGKKSAVVAGGLASNESALGTSPAVGQLLPTLRERLHRYPDPLATELRSAIAKQHGVKDEQVLVGNGSDELIYLIALAYLAQNGTALCASPAYKIDEISSLVVIGKVKSVPLVNWTHDLESMAEVDAN